MRFISTRLIAITMLFALAGALAGCAGSGSKGGGYYKDDGPMARTPKNVHHTPDAVPRIEPFARANMRPYKVLGHSFVPITDSRPFSQTGVASWYGKKFHGKQTANGERYDMYAMTAAHPTLPLPSYARVTRIDNNKSIIVRINDRGPFHSQRIIDLSYAAASKLDMIGPGKATVHVEAITHDDIRAGRYAPAEQKTLALSAPAAQSARASHAVHSSSGSGNSAATADRSAGSSAQHDTATADPLSDFLAQQQQLGRQSSSAQSGSAPQRSGSAQQSGSGGLSASVAHSSRVNTEQRDGFFLQFGAFRSQDSAQQLAQRVQMHLDQHYPQGVQIHSQHDFHRVRLGPFNSRTEAVNAAIQVQQSTGKQPQITYVD